MSSRCALALMALLALTASLLPSALTDAQTPDAVTVQIQARQLETGQIEFGVRVNRGDMILPRARLFPVDAPSERWLQSSVFELAGEFRGRLIASRLTTGEVQFGLLVVGERYPYLYGPTIPVDVGHSDWIRFDFFIVHLSDDQMRLEEPTAPAGAPDTGESTIALIRERGSLRCGVKQTQPLFGLREADGTVTGFDIEFCKALAAALAVELTLIDASDASTRFELLNWGELDVLIRTTTHTASRDRNLRLDFTRPTFYTGQGFAVRTDSDIYSTADMGDAIICVQSGTTTEQNLANHFTDIRLNYEPIGGVWQDLADAFFNDRCDVLTADASLLASLIAVREDRDDYTVLGQLISKEPLAPSVREGDDEWKDVVNWVVNGLIIAEEEGITRQNVAMAAAHPPNTTIARLLGVSYEGGEVSTLGFDAVGAQFIQRAIAEVGNYGEIYERTIGNTIPRACSLNALASEDKRECLPGTGGILYALPYR